MCDGGEDTESRSQDDMMKPGEEFTQECFGLHAVHALQSVISINGPHFLSFVPEIPRMTNSVAFKAVARHQRFLWASHF